MNFTELEQRLGFKATLPFTPDWSAAPDFLGLIAEHCLSAKPSIIVECSSGTSTLVLAQCCRLNGRGHVYSLENGVGYAAATVQNLEEFGLQAYASVIHAPLVDYRLNGHKHVWYSLDKLNVQDIDMLVIDGPPAVIDSQARYPALPLLYNKLAAGCAVYLDDANRPGEQAIVKRWCEMFPALRPRYAESERGCAVLAL